MTNTTRPWLTCLILSTTLAACLGGGGGDVNPDPGGGGDPDPAGWTCDTTLFVPDSVAAPTAEELATYAGTYDGDEGTFGPNPGDPFVKSGEATFVLNADGTVSYKDTAITVASICRDKTAGAAGRFLYVHTADGHIDVTEAGEAFGISLTDPALLFQNGVKR